MDLENQKRVKSLTDQHGKENIIVLLGGADPEASGLIAETVINGDPALAGVLTGVQLGLSASLVLEVEVKKEIVSDLYESILELMELVLDVDSLAT